MAVQILSQSYGPRKPLIECTADSLDDLVGLVCAEGSTATVGGTEYVLDRVNGWIEPGSGGGGGGSGVLVVNESYDSATSTWTMDTVASEIWSAMQTGLVIVVSDISSSVIANAQYVPEDSEEYYFVICDNAGPEVYSAANGDDYPARVMS